MVIEGFVQQLTGIVVLQTIERKGMLENPRDEDKTENIFYCVAGIQTRRRYSSQSLFTFLSSSRDDGCCRRR